MLVFLSKYENIKTYVFIARIFHGADVILSSLSIVIKEKVLFEHHVRDALF